MQAKTNEKSNTFTVKLPLPKQITRGPLSMDPQVLGFIAVYIYLSDLAFCVPETFHAKFPVLVKSVFKIVTCALPLRPTPNHPATSKLRDRRRIYLFFRAKGELRGRAKRECFPRALCETTQQTNWGYAARDKKTSDTQGRFFSFHFLFFIELESFVPF